MCDEQQIVLFSFKFKNDRLQPHCQVVIGLYVCEIPVTLVPLSGTTYFRTRIPMMIRILFVFLHLLWHFLPDPLF